MQYDKWLHSVVSFMLTVMLIAVTQFFFPWWVAVSCVLVVGLYKELHDIQTTGFDWKDIVADCVGISLAMCLWALAI